MSENRPIRIGAPLYGGAFTTSDPALTLPFVLPGEITQFHSPQHSHPATLGHCHPERSEGPAFLARAASSSAPTILTPSPGRTIPLCPHFTTCGGCQYQHATHPTQLSLKRDILQGILRQAEIADPPDVQLHASSEPYGYRNRIRLRIERVDGALRLGYNIRASTGFLPITTCPISAPGLLQTAAALLALAPENPDAAHWLNAAAELELFTNHDLSRIQLTLFVAPRTRSPQGSFTRMIDALQQQAPAVAGAKAEAFDPRTGPTGRTLAEHGATGLNYKAGDETYWVSRGGFFQVNRFLIETLVRLVTTSSSSRPESARGANAVDTPALSFRPESARSADAVETPALSSRPESAPFADSVERPAVRTGQVAWDLFAGVGLFSRILARTFAQVTAVEAGPIASADLAAAFKKLGPQHRAVAETTLAFLQKAVTQRERPDLVVLDPPRAGAGIEACELLARFAPREIVYVSCDPTTLARDLAFLQKAYKITELHLIDLFPQTFHIETVAVLGRKL